MLQISKGLSISLIILEILRNFDELNDIDIIVGTFTNCRECGLTFAMFEGRVDDHFTFCVYEHRNSDNIIINGKKGLISMNGDLPYCADSKWKFLAEFNYNEHYQCAVALKDLILEKYRLAKNNIN